MNKVSPGAARRHAPPADGSSTVAKIAANGSAHPWRPAVAKLQAAIVPIAYAGTDKRTDRQTDRAIPECLLGWEHNNAANICEDMFKNK